MSNSILIMGAIRAIAKETSTNNKLALLTKHAREWPEFRRVLLATYHPLTTYGVKSFPAPSKHGRAVFDEGTWKLLARLATRELSGNEALKEIADHLAWLEPESAELLQRILLRDLQAGFADTLINKAYKGLIPKEPYMRCSLPADAKLDEWEWGQGVFSQLKADGSFLKVNRSGGDVWFTTRSGQRYPEDALPGLAEEVLEVLDDETQTHGELLVVGPIGDVLPRKTGNGILNSVLQGAQFPAKHHPLFLAWDQIPIKWAVHKGSCPTAYKDRFGGLVTQISSDKCQWIGLIESRRVLSLADAYAHCAEVQKRGLEGTIIKRPSAGWRDTGSSGDKGMVKLKVEAQCELRMKELIPGDQRGKHAATFGSVRCRSECGLLEVDVSGFTDETRAHIHANWHHLENGVMTVTFNDIMISTTSKPHSLYLPRFEEIRHDKSTADSLEQIRAIFSGIVGSPSAPQAVTAQPSVRRIKRTRK